MHRQRYQPVSEEGDGGAWGFNQRPTRKVDVGHHPGGDAPSARQSTAWS